MKCPLKMCNINVLYLYILKEITNKFTFDAVEVEQYLSDHDARIEKHNHAQQNLYRVALEELDNFLAPTAVSNHRTQDVPRRESL